jgi:hypothetical protein
MLLTTYPNDSIFVDTNREYPHLAYGCEARYKWSTGLVQMPIAGSTAGPTLQAGVLPGNVLPPPQPTCAIIRLSQPCGVKIVSFHGVRQGQQVIIPAPETDDPNAILLEAEVVQTAPAILDDVQTPRYEVRGVYVYALLIPVDGGQGFPGVSAPNVKTPKSQNDLPLANIVNGIA